MFILCKHILTHTHTASLRHRGKRSWRICCILAPHWPPWHWSMAETRIEFTNMANQRDSISFTKQGYTVFLSATSSRWVPTLSWRTTAGRGHLTSSTWRTRSCWSSLAWLSTTDNTWLLKPHTRLKPTAQSPDCSAEMDRKGHVSPESWFSERPQLWRSRTVDVWWKEGWQSQLAASWVESSPAVQIYSFRSFYTVVNWMKHLISSCWFYLACRWN